MYGSAPSHEKTTKAPEWRLSMRELGRSILRFVEIVADHVRETVGEFLKDEEIGDLAALGEDVAPQTLGFILETDKNEE